MQEIINDKLKEIAKVGELIAVEKEQTPIEYRMYVREQDKRRLPRYRYKLSIEHKIRYIAD